MSNLKKIVLLILLLGIVAGGLFVYNFYNVFFNPNTAFNNDKAFVFISSNASFDDVREQLTPLLKNVDDFETTANKKGYKIKGGKYAIKKGMNNNEIVNSLRSNNIPIKISFNNQDRLELLAGRIAAQLEKDSVDFLNAFRDETFLKEKGFSLDDALTMYVPNSYEVYWNLSPEGFRDRMYKEYKSFWNTSRIQKAKTIGYTPIEIVSLAAIVDKESVKIEERPRIAGVYLNRLKKGIRLQADPTVIYAMQKAQNNFDLVIKRVLSKDLEIDSPYNTYKNIGIPPGPISMPDISAVDAVLNAEKHNYIFFVADIERFGYHLFAETHSQHIANANKYRRWATQNNILR
ncbi:endolytic transglycosylase MltG [Spongiivirga citrea]|uniref:Endolytic murein transglycosylase n=1 Tax=Spongiivirga citrea TaxID=1481457 RepID=A0A6M0CDA1_9FLAO|nr:endolytic transglycosylase MltG [Spongiivirga citrea]NER15786.1 endolytic transglycosylase MltG [Spongiivirga citrea]